MTDTNTQTTQQDFHLIDLASNIVTALVGNTHVHVTPSDISAMLKDTYSTLASLSVVSSPQIVAEPAAPAVRQEPAVSVRASVKPDYLVCLEDGKRVKMLKRYLMANYGLTPDDYRAKWGLPGDYPMVAPNYSEHRRHLAMQIGLGTKGRHPKAVAVVAPKVTKGRAKA